MTRLHGDNLERLIVEALVRELDLKGTLDVLRHGFKFYGQTFRLAWFKPAHGLNPEALAQFARNELTITRQVPCHPGSGATVDLVFALNGLPVATCELKNPMDRSDLAQRRAAVPAGPRPKRPDLQVPQARPGPLRRRPRRDSHDDAAGGRAGRASSPSTAAAGPAISAAARATRRILRATAPATSGKRCWSASGSWTFWARTCSSSAATRRSRTTRARAP